MRTILSLSRAFVALSISLQVKLLRLAAQQKVAAVQAVGDEYTATREKIDAITSHLHQLEIDSGKKLDAYIKAHADAVKPISELTTEAERYETFNVA